jgi:DnaK suppressor protein
MLTHQDLNLEEFKTLLMAEKEKIERNAELLGMEADSLVENDEVGDLADVAELQIDSAKDRTMLAQLRAKLAEVEAALARIESGSYGVCEETGKLIPKERLSANPTARTLVNI